MRGKVEQREQMQISIRITPAYAGKSRFAHYGERGERDHPRLCGEKQFFRIAFQPSTGSPPPMRGKVAAFFEPIGSLGITPAYAGKSSRYRLISISSRDHPRLCGEKPPVGVPDNKITGSPPPMRGKGLRLL